MGCCPPRSLVSEFLYAPHTSRMTAAWGSSRDNAVRGGVGVGETHSLLIPGRGGGSVLKG